MIAKMNTEDMIRSLLIIKMEDKES